MPVIMTTADPEPALEVRAAAIGAVCLLRKPFEADAMTDCLKKGPESLIANFLAFHSAAHRERSEKWGDGNRGEIVS